jgi:hypothetical protein
MPKNRVRKPNHPPRRAKNRPAARLPKKILRRPSFDAITKIGKFERRSRRREEIAFGAGGTESTGENQKIRAKLHRFGGFL